MAIHGQRDSISIAELICLVDFVTSVSKHTNLARIVGQVVLTADFLELGNEAVLHLFHTAEHPTEVLVLHGGQLGITEDSVNDTDIVNERFGVDGPGKLLDPAHEGAANVCTCYFQTASQSRRASSSVCLLST